MDDQRFVELLNGVAGEHRLRLPALGRGESPSSAFVSDWARFLELCVKKGVSLSDVRWQRLSIAAEAPHTRFRLEASGVAEPDADFRVGLQLLMGMLEDDEETPETPPDTDTMS